MCSCGSTTTAATSTRITSTRRRNGDHHERDLELNEMTPDQATWFAEVFGRLAANIGHAVRLALTCLVSEGHLLLEDFPGTGKTSLAKALANTVHGSNSRIQFTPDLLPSDVTGVTIY